MAVRKLARTLRLRWRDGGSRVVGLSVFALSSLVGWVIVVLLALSLRSRAYAMFRGVTLGLHALFASVMVGRFPDVIFPLFVALHAMALI